MNRQTIENWFTGTLLGGISIANWTFAAAVALGSYLLMLAVLRFALTRLKAIQGRTATRVDDIVVDVLEGTNRFLLGLVAMLIGIGMLTLPALWNERVSHLWFVVFGLQLALWLNRGITLGTRHYELHGQATETMKASASATIAVWTLRVLLWSVVLLAMLSNLGVNITAFVASLGISGIAVALAVQNILGDLFASLSIAVDKPFEVDDFISMGDVMGSVEQIGLKTTRLRSLSGEQIILSNTELLKNTIRNFKRMANRRCVFAFGLTYDATPEQLADVPLLVRRIVEAAGKVRFDRAHFKEFGASALNFEVVYFVLDPDFNLYMDIQQKINLELMRELDRLGLGFAFPTQTLYLERASTPQASQRRTETPPPLRRAFEH